MLPARSHGAGRGAGDQRGNNPDTSAALQINLLERVARDRVGMATKVNPPMRVALATVLILLGGCNIAQAISTFISASICLVRSSRTGYGPAMSVHSVRI